MKQSGPWDDYKKQESGPWDDYATPAPAPVAETPKLAATPAKGVEAAPTWDQRLSDQAHKSLGGLAPFTIDPLVGAMKGIGSTAQGLKDLLTGSSQEKPSFLKPQNAGEKVGFYGEQIGEFALPGMAAGKVPAVANVLAKGGKAAIGARAAIEGIGAGAITAAQTGGDKDAAFTSAVIGGTIPVIAPVVGAAMRATGTKIEESVLRSTAADRAHGFDIKNVFKHNVGGTPQQVATKAEVKITKLAGELKAELAKNPSTKLDILGMIGEVEKDLAKGGVATFGRNKSASTALSTLVDELAIVSPTGKVDIADAQTIKRQLGLLGAWIEGARDPESKGMQVAANMLYTKIKTAIEGAAVNGSRVKEINKALGELIPIEHVAVKRIPVTERQNLISLTDVIAMSGAVHNPMNWWIFTVNQLSKSGRVGNAMVKSGAGATGQWAATAIAGSASQAGRTGR